MMKTVIIEDEKAIRSVLRSMLENYCADSVEIVGEADSVPDAAHLIRRKKPDLVLLDVQLAKGTGFEVLNLTRECEYEVIFITAYDQYAIKAIKFSALDYLMKPIDPDELEAAIKKAEESISAKQENIRLKSLLENNPEESFPPQQLVIASTDGYQILQTQDIIYLEADGGYTSIFLTDGQKVISSKTLKTYEELLKESRFSRVHHSFLVNFTHIKAVVNKGNCFAIMSNEAEIPVSRRKRAELISSFSPE